MAMWPTTQSYPSDALDATYGGCYAWICLVFGKRLSGDIDTGGREFKRNGLVWWFCETEV
jgi:hypothetical protein